MVVEQSERVVPGAPSADISALAHVANRPIIHHVIEALAAAGVRAIVIATTSESHKPVHDLLAGCAATQGIGIQYVDAPRSLDLAGGLSLAAPLIGDAPCIVHTAAGLLNEPLDRFVTQMRPGAPDMMLFVHQGPSSYAVLDPASRRLLHLAELDPRRDALGMAGVLLFGPAALRHAAVSRWWGRRGIDLTTITEEIAAAGGILHVRLAGLWHGYSGSALDLLELNRAVLDRMEGGGGCDGNGNRIEGRVHIHAGASVTGSVIVGPAIIGPGARICDAYIGPYTAVGAHARIEGAEIERSIISAGATIMHIGCRLAGSVIGRDARVFRDFSVPRGMRLRVGDGTEVALS